MTETSGNLALKKETASKFTLPALRTRFSSAGNARCIVVLGQKRLFAPTNLHLYHYAVNNPVKYTNLDGRDIIQFLDQNRGRASEREHPLLSKIAFGHAAALVGNDNDASNQMLLNLLV